MTPRAVIARRFAAAWKSWIAAHRSGDHDRGLACLRRWTRLRAALERQTAGSREPSGLVATIRPASRGGARIRIPVPAAFRRDLDSHPARATLDAAVASAFTILAATARDPHPATRRLGRAALFSLGRSLSPLASFGRQPLEFLQIDLGRAAWRDARLAADCSGISAPRLLAALAVCCWAESAVAEKHPAFPPSPIHN